MVELVHWEHLSLELMVNFSFYFDFIYFNCFKKKNLAAAIWATGKTWWQVPPIAKVNLIGKLSPGVTGKDVIITLCGFFNKDEVLNHCIEFDGEGIAELSIDERLSIANMTTEWGALAGLFPVDEKTIQWYKNRINFLKRRG